MRLAIGLCVLGVLLGTTLADTVGWRTDGTGRYPDAEPPVTFSPTESVVWATPMPAWSNASPVIVGNRIFVCAEPDVLLAVDKTTGAILWQKANPIGVALHDAKKIPTHAHNGYTSATPTSDGERVFAVFGTGSVAAYDLEGRHLWSRLLERPKNRWGHSASPLLAGGKLLVHVETLVALDPANGSILWRQPAETWTNQRQKNWGSPVATRIGETDVAITAAGRVIRISDGEVLFDKLARIQFASPLVVDGVAYFIGKNNGRAVRLPETLDGTPEVLWNTKTAKDRYYGSPLVHDGRLYAISQRGNFSAFDAKTGREFYRKKLLLADTEKDPNAAYTSVTLGGTSLYFAGMDGSIVVVAPGPEYKQLARNKIEKSLRGNPVFEGTRMYLRAPGKLYCFGN